jgi:hypothetical protein
MRFSAFSKHLTARRRVYFKRAFQPKEVSRVTRQLLTVVFITVVLSTVIGFTLGWAAGPENANATTAATPGQETVRQLKRVNAHLGALNVKLAALNTKTGDTQTQEGSVRALLTIICDYTAPINCKPR